jgi:nitrite reductase (NADH) large subunit
VKLVVIGNGMVGQRFVEALVARDTGHRWSVTVLGEEHRPAYDRVRLSAYFEGVTADGLTLAPPGVPAGVRIRRGVAATGIDTAARVVRTGHGEYPYDALVLATGSRPFVPPVPGADGPGRFVYRTLDDLEALRAFAPGRTTGTVVGGGLLGLEAANALRLLGLETSIVEFAPHLMPVQLDPAGGGMLRRRIEALGIAVHCGTGVAGIEPAGDRLTVQTNGELTLETDLVVFAAGVRPRDELWKSRGAGAGFAAVAHRRASACHRRARSRRSGSAVSKSAAPRRRLQSRRRRVRPTHSSCCRLRPRADSRASSPRRSPGSWNQRPSPTCGPPRHAPRIAR